jgi:hypothetical protein
MSQPQKAPEPGMEDLLASIRKAINEDSSARPAVLPGATTVGGPSRESRSRSDEHGGLPADRPQSEILELRNRDS